jgi:hypothetical protein
MDLESVGPSVTGCAYLFPDDSSLLSTAFGINCPDVSSEFQISGAITHFYRNTGHIPSWNEIAAKYPNAEFPTKANVKFLGRYQNELNVEWETEIGTNGTSKLTRTDINAPSKVEVKSNVRTWEEFQDFVRNSSEATGWIYRGQQKNWPLRTGFFRTTRRDLRRYMNEDIPRLHQVLSSRTKHFFDLRNDHEMGAFLNLAQHHGFPTPLLDWSRSPYVGAYFAYKDVPNDELESIRIYAFDYAQYKKDVMQLQGITLTQPHFSIIEAISLENERAIPQQGLLTLTNVDDIEGYLSNVGRVNGRKYLLAFDLDGSEAVKVRADLKLMGITKSTMFPSIESFCEEMKAEYF